MSNKNRYELFSNKRKAANFFRQTASAIDEYGWKQGSYGSSKDGGFCLVGALGFVVDGKDHSNDECVRLHDQYVIPHVISVGTARKLLSKKQVGRGYMVGEGFNMINFNDDADTEKEEVTSFLRKLARHLEHGGHL